MDTEPRSVKCRWCYLRVASPCEQRRQTVISLCFSRTNTRVDTPQQQWSVAMGCANNVNMREVLICANKFKEELCKNVADVC